MKNLNINVMFWITVFVFAFAINVAAQNKHSNTEINWLTIEQVEAQLKIKPKKVYIDVYTDWCGWCKVMDKEVFGNTKAIQFMNDNFYCVHLNAEKLREITYKGKKYTTAPNNKINELVLTWMQNKTSYPTSIFFDEHFNMIQPLPGYLKLPIFEEIIKFLSGDNYKKMPFEDYKKTMTDRW
jgi:thioredoxin-related protein